MRDTFREDSFIQFKLLFDVLVLIGLSQIGEEVTLHQCLILTGNLLGCDSVNAVSIVSHTDEQGTEKDAHIETIALLPSGNIGRRGYTPRKLIRRVQLLILDELAEPLRALLVVVQFEEAQFGGANGGADELIHFALVFGEEEELPVLADVLLELLLELDDMLEHQLLLRGVLPVGHARRLLLLELPAALQFLVDDVLAALEELAQLAVGLALHLKISIIASIISFIPDCNARNRPASHGRCSNGSPTIRSFHYNSPAASLLPSAPEARSCTCPSGPTRPPSRGRNCLVIKLLPFGEITHDLIVKSIDFALTLECESQFRGRRGRRGEVFRGRPQLHILCHTLTGVWL